MHWLHETLFIAACLVLPIAWGWLVNWLFARYGQHRQRRHHDEAGYIDYHI